MKAGDLAQARARWDDAAHAGRLAGIHWMASPVVRRHLNRLATGDPDADWLTWVRQRYLRGPVPTGVLVLGCGEGWLERALAGDPGIARLDASDAAAAAVERARQTAAAAGLTIGYTVKDLDRDELPAAAYGLVIAHQVLHHVENLEFALAQIERALVPGGVLVANEYVGPARFQFSDAQMTAINEVMVRLPERHRRGLVEGVVFPHKERPTVELMLREDPSEAVRADEILPLIAARFAIEAELPCGGALLQHLLYDIVQNFAPGDPWDDAVLQLCCALEEQLTAAGDLASDFVVVAARRRGAF